MSRKVPANRMDDEKRELLLDLLARGVSQPVIAERVGCSGSTVYAYSKRYASEIQARAAKLPRRSSDGPLERTIRRAVTMAHELLDELGACTVEQRMERFAQNVNACARLLKELHNLRQLQAGEPTARIAREVSETTTVTVIEPAPDQDEDPLGFLRRDRMN